MFAVKVANILCLFTLSPAAVVQQKGGQSISSLKTINIPQINNAQNLDLISSLTILSRRSVHLAEVGLADKQLHKIWPKPIANVKQSQGAGLLCENMVEWENGKFYPIVLGFFDHDVS